MTFSVLRASSGRISPAGVSVRTENACCPCPSSRRRRERKAVRSPACSSRWTRPQGRAPVLRRRARRLGRSRSAALACDRLGRARQLERRFRPAAPGTPPTRRAGAWRPSASSSSAKIARASLVHASSPARQSSAEAARAAPRSRRARRRGAGSRAAARPCRSSGSPSAGRRCRSGRAASQPVELGAEPERDRRAGVAAALADAEAQMLALADDARLRPPRTPARAASRPGCRGRTAPAARARVARPSVSAEPGTIASIRVTGARSSSASARVGVRGERGRERLEVRRARSRGPRRRGGRRSAAGARSRRRARRAGRTPAASGPSPSSRRRVPAIRTTGRLKRSTSRDATIPITPSCQSSPQIT